MSEVSKTVTGRQMQKTHVVSIPLDRSRSRVEIEELIAQRIGAGRQDGWHFATAFQYVPPGLGNLYAIDSHPSIMLVFCK